MASKDNTILFSVGFDQAKLEKELGKFSRAFAKGLKEQLGQIDIAKALNFGKTGIKIPVTLDMKGARTQLEEFQKNIKPFTIKVRIEDEKTSTKTGTASVSSGTSTKGTTGGGIVTGFDPATITLNQGAIVATTQRLAALRTELRQMGFDETEVSKATQNLEKELQSVQRIFTAIQRERLAAQQSAGPNAPLPDLTDKQILGLNKAGIQLGTLNTHLQDYNKETALANVQTKRAEAFMDSFGFKVGILGFGMGILGGHFQRLSQAMLQFAENSAKATEPLERVTNLVSQLVEEGTIPADKKDFIFSEINRLADLPGANLDSITKSFRQLSTLGLDIVGTLKLVEGITKATGRAGTGAEGVTRVVQQLREFATNPEGKFSERDVRALSEGGGADVTKVIKKFGGAAGVQAAGPQAFLKGLTEDLGKIPAPLDATIDKFNRLTNSFVRMRVELEKILSPGLDTLLENFKNLEVIVGKLSKSFEGLSDNTKVFLSQLLVAIPLLAGLLGGFLTVLSAVGIAVASGKQVIDAYKVAITGLSKVLGPTSELFSNLNYEIRFFGLAIEEVIKSFSASSSVLAFFFFGEGAASTEALASSLSKVTSVLGRVIGLTGPIGIIVNLLLAFITNIGHFRDIILDTFGPSGKVATAIERFDNKLLELFSKLFNSKGLSFVSSGLGKILDILEAIAGLIAGTLANLASIIPNFIAELLDAASNLIDFFQNPSQENFAKFFVAFESAGVNVFINFGKLMAASLIETLASILPSEGLRGILPGGNKLREQAAQLRADVFPDINKRLNDPLRQAVTNANQLTTAFKQVDKEVLDIQKSFDDFARKIARLQIDLKLNEIKFESDRTNTRTLDALEKAIQAGTINEAGIRQNLGANATRTVTTIRQAAGENVKDNLSALNTAMGEILAVQQSKQSFGGWKVITPQSVLDFKRLADVLVNVNNAAKGGRSDWSAYVDQIKSVLDIGNNLRKDLPGSDADANAVKSALTTLGNFYDVIKRRETDVQQVQFERAENEDKYIKMLNERNKALVSEDVQQVIREELRQANERLANEERNLELLKESGATNDVISTQMGNIKNVKDEILNIDERLAKASIVEADNLKVKQIENEKALKLTQQQRDLDIQRLEIARQLISEAKKANTELSGRLVESLAKFRALRTLPGDSTTTLTAELQKRLFSQGDILSDQAGLAFEETAKERTRKLLQEAQPLTEVFRKLGVDSASIFTLFSNSIKGLKDSSGDFEEATSKLILESSTSLINLQRQLGSLGRLEDDLLQRRTKQGQSPKFYAEIDKQLAVIKDKEFEISSVIAVINKLEGITNDTIAERNRRIQESLDKKLREVNLAKQIVATQQEILQIEAEVIAAEQKNQEAKASKPGHVFDATDLGAQDELANRQLETEIALIQKRTEVALLDVEARKLEAETKLKLANATQAEINSSNAVYDALAANIVRIHNLQVDTSQINNATDAFTRFKNVIQNFASSGLQAAFDAIIHAIQNFNNRAKVQFSKSKSIADVGIGVIVSLVTALPDILTSSISDFLAGTDTFVNALLKGFGSILSTLGAMIVKLVLTNAALAFVTTLNADLAAFVPFWIAIGHAFVAFASTLAAQLPLLAIGIGLMAAGAVVTQLGTPGQVSGTNATNSANQQAGAKGEEFDPNKDPRTIYQKALMAQITIDVKTDDAAIVKTVIKHVNQNGRLTTLIGNRKLRFGY